MADFVKLTPDEEKKFESLSLKPLSDEEDSLFLQEVGKVVRDRPTLKPQRPVKFGTITSDVFDGPAETMQREGDADLFRTTGAMPFTGIPADEGFFQLKGEDIAASMAGFGVTAVTAPFIGPASIPLGVAAAGFAGGSIHYAKTGDFKSSLAEGAMQALFETVPAAWDAFRRHAKPMSRMVRDFQKEAMKQFESVGGHLTLDQMTRSALVDKLADVAGSSFFGGGGVTMFKGEIQEEYLKDIFANVLENIKPGGLNPSEAGTIFKGAMDIADKAIKEISDDMYATLYSATGDARITLSSVEKELGIERIIVDEKGLVGGEATKKPFTLKTGRRGSGDTELNRVIDDVLDLSELHGGSLPFEEADNLLKGVNRDLKKAIKANDRQAIRKLKGAKKALRTDIDAVLSPKGLVEHYDHVLDEYTKMATVMKNDFVTKLHHNIATHNPEAVVKTIKKDNPSDLQRMKDVLLNPPEFNGKQLPKAPEAWSAAKRVFLDKRWSTGVADAVANQKMGREGLNHFLGLEDETLNVLFTPAEQKNLGNFVDAVVARGESGAKGGGMLIQLMQAGALVGIVGAPFSGELREEIGMGSAVLLIAPWKMGRMLMDKKFVKLMTEGLTTAGKTDAGLSLLPRLYRRYAELSLEDERGPSMMVPIEDLGVFEGPNRLMFGGQFDPTPDEQPITP